ncbi:MAG: hypothetical protein HAW60_00595 [Bdellovibrionales bacterium]|nr:hypothetical protein [Bdellovibrionales bacterium]
MSKPVKIFSKLDDIDFTSCVLSIGNFDGVHIAHQALLKKLLTKKKEYKSPSVVVSFEPHPVEFFTKKKIRLFSSKYMASQLTKIGIDYLILLKFDQELASLSAKDFLEKKLQILRPKAIVVGTDFCFGNMALGTADTLKAWSLSNGVDCYIFPDVYLGNSKVSSSRIRNCYEKNKLKELEDLLGRPATELKNIK